MPDGCAGSSGPWSSCCAPASHGTICRSGSAKPNSLYRRYRRWSQRGIWDELFTTGVPEDALETVMVDATITKAQRFASGARGGGEEDLGRSLVGLTT